MYNALCIAYPSGLAFFWARNASLEYGWFLESINSMGVFWFSVSSCVVSKPWLFCSRNKSGTLKALEPCHS